MNKPVLLHLGLIAALIAAGVLLPAYHQGNLARILVLATYAVGYNVLFGYTGLLSLGHAMFFGAGMYGLAYILSLAMGFPLRISAQSAVLGVTVSFIVGIVSGLYPAWRASKLSPIDAMRDA